jgi:hypothetical protein
MNTRDGCTAPSLTPAIATTTSLTIFASAIDWIVLPVRSPVADLLSDLSRAFAALNMPWYLFGAQAAIVYGVARLTADVDVTARAPAIGPASVWVGKIEQHGFTRRFTDPAFIEHSRVIPLVHQQTGLPVDIVLAGPGLEDEFLSRAVAHTIDEVTVPVVEVSDLVILKALAGRPKDIEDLVTLLHVQRHAIDEARVREVLGMLEQALGQSDLLPVFDAVLRRARG